MKSIKLTKSILAVVTLTMLVMPGAIFAQDIGQPERFNPGWDWDRRER
jgi:hypothetical protein